LTELKLVYTLHNLMPSVYLFMGPTFRVIFYLSFWVYNSIEMDIEILDAGTSNVYFSVTTCYGKGKG